MRIAFCVYGLSEETFRRTEFYFQDFDILTSLGHDVRLVTRPWQIRTSDHLAFAWWWNHIWLWAPAAALAGVPLVTTGVFDDVEFKTLPLYKRALKKLGASLSHLNIVVSQHEYRILPSIAPFRRKPLRYIPLSVDTSIYRPTDRRYSNASEFRILNVSWHRMTNIRRKMIAELLEAFALFSREYPEARLTLAGAPDDGGRYLISLANSLGVSDKVEFPGELSRDEKVRRMQTCSLYCQVSKHEGFGVAIAEAMACGAPVLVSRVGAVPEVVGDCGQYVEEISVSGILNGLIKCRQLYNESLFLTENPVRRIQTLFSRERRLLELKKCLDELV